MLHCVLMKLYGKEKDGSLFEYLAVDEELLDVGDDLVDYEVKASVRVLVGQDDV